MTHVFHGHCPVCNRDTQFASPDNWYRDHLNCQSCGSIPRERAFAWALDRFCSDWRDKTIHESSPSERLVSTRMRDHAREYIGTQFFPDLAPGAMRNGFRSENLEGMSFADASIDLHVHLDVLEHVNHPNRCFSEMERTLRPGGMMIFTTPIYEHKVETERRGYIDENNKINFLGEPEYHGNPIDHTGSPVTFH